MYKDCKEHIKKTGVHTKNTCQTKTTGFKKSNDELKDEYWKFILKMRKERIFCCEPGNIRSIDVTYTKKPQTHVTTFSPQGSSKPKSNYEVDYYTNTIVTMLSGDGINHTPCLLYTHDPKMAPKQKNTDRGKRVRDEFEQALLKYNISENRIIYQKSNKNFYAESPDVYEHFLNNYDISKDCVILHVRGNAFK